MKKAALIIAIILIVILAAAYIFISKSNSSKDTIIEKILRSDDTETIQTIYSCTYKGNQVYYVASNMPDSFISLLDEKGNYICSPSGGLSGKGDGTCTDFDYNTCKVIWQK